MIAPIAPIPSPTEVTAPTMLPTLPPIDMSMSMMPIAPIPSPTEATAPSLPTMSPTRTPIVAQPSKAPTETSPPPTSAPTKIRQEEVDQLRKDYNFARAQWTRTGITSYSHSQEFTGLVDNVWNKVIRVEVVNGILVSRTFQDGTIVDDADSPLGLSEYVVPINDIFDFINGVIENAKELVVGYDEELGYPSYVYYQPLGELPGTPHILCL